MTASEKPKFVTAGKEPDGLPTFEAVMEMFRQLTDEYPKDDPEDLAAARAEYDAMRKEHGLPPD